ncbi:MAG: hypothetical protein QUT30_13235 [Acidobacteriota bacterium]|nr:hypothetical protein [Acidobacteriota bacterium]
MKKITWLCLMVFALTITAFADSAKDNHARYVWGDVSGVMNGRFTFDGPWEGPWTVKGELKGELDYLGFLEMYTSHTTSSDGMISQGKFKIVDANGNVILGAYTASALMISNSQALGMAAFSITGGTGCYVHATGTISASFLETFDDPTFASAQVTWALDGLIRHRKCAR